MFSSDHVDCPCISYLEVHLMYNDCSQTSRAPRAPECPQYLRQQWRVLLLIITQSCTPEQFSSSMKCSVVRTSVREQTKQVLQPRVIPQPSTCRLRDICCYEYFQKMFRCARLSRMGIKRRLQYSPGSSIQRHGLAASSVRAPSFHSRHSCFSAAQYIISQRPT